MSGPRQEVAATERTRRDRAVCAVFVVLLATFLLYAPSIGNDFTWDDRHAAMGSGAGRHPLVAELRPIGDYFSHNWWPHYSPCSEAYRPLTTLWFALRYAVCGDQALVAHLLNVLLHAATVGLAMLLLRRLGASFRGVVCGGLVFGLHAMHSEAVANLVGGAELLALAFGLSAALVLHRSLEVGRGRGWLYCVAGGGLVFAAAASKESGLVWVVFAPLCALLPAWSRGRSWRELRPVALAMALPVLVAAGCYLQLRACMLATLAVRPDPAVGLLENPLLDVPTAARVASGLLAWGHGLLLTLLPFHLSVDYGPSQLPIVRQWHEPWVFGAIAIGAGFVGVVVLAVGHARRRPMVCLAAACFFGFSCITSNVFVPVFMHFAERSYTTPSLAMALLVAGVASGTPRRRGVAIAGGATLAGWCLLSVVTALPRNGVWSDDDTLVLREVESSPHSVRLQLCAGVLQRNRGNVALAREHLTHASQLAPHLPQPWLELADLALRQHDFAAAKAHAERAEAANARELKRCTAGLATLRARLAAASPR